MPGLPGAQIIPPQPTLQPSGLPQGFVATSVQGGAKLLVYRNAVVNVANTFTFTTIPFDVIEYPIGVSDVPYYSRTSGILTVPRGPLVRVDSSVIMNAPGAGSLGLRVLKNGATEYRLDTGYNGAGNPAASGSRLIPVVVGDTLVIQVAQSTPTNPASPFTGVSFCWCQFEFGV